MESAKPTVFVKSVTEGKIKMVCQTKIPSYFIMGITISLTSTFSK